MADSIILSDGTTDIQLVKDTATHDYQWKYGMRVGGRPPRPLWHIPDNSPPQIVRLVNDTQEISFGLQVYPSDDSWDTAINDLNTIKRWIDGDDQQAARYHTDGDVNKIYLRVQLDGMTNYTDWTILYGNVDDSISFYQDAALLNKRMLSVNITLTCEPVGNGASFTMRNDLASSPHFLEDSNSDGVADGWAQSGMSSTSIPAFRWMVGGKTQLCVTASTGNSLIQSSQVTLASGQDVCASGWIAIATDPSDTIYFRITDGSGVTVQEKAISAADTSNATRSILSQSGHTFYRMDVGGTLANANYRVSWIRKSADATKQNSFYIDLCYSQSGTTTAPDGWCSTSSIENRNDPDSSNEDQIGYIDFWGIPGDSDAILTTNYNLHISGRKIFIFSRWADGRNLATEYKHWLDTAQSGWTVSSTGNTNGSWTNTSSASYSGGSARRFTASGGTGSGTTTLTLTDGEAVDFVRGQRRAFLVASCSNTAVDIQVTALVRDFNSSSIINLLESSTVNLPATTNIYLLDLGILDGTPLLSDDVPNVVTSTTVRLEIAVSAVPNGATVDVDALFLPVVSGNDFMILNPVNDVPVISSNGYVDIFGSTQQVTTGRSAVTESGVQGSFYTLKPGVMNRAVFVQLQDTQQMILDDAMDISFSVIPRTRHLLGTS